MSICSELGIEKIILDYSIVIMQMKKLLMYLVVAAVIAAAVLFFMKKTKKVVVVKKESFKGDFSIDSGFYKVDTAMGGSGILTDPIDQSRML